MIEIGFGEDESGSDIVGWLGVGGLTITPTRYKSIKGEPVVGI